MLVAAAFAGLAIVATSGRDGEAQDLIPSNDNFDRSKPVDIGSPSGYQEVTSTSGATLESGEPTCVADSGATVWYIFFPQTSGNIIIDTAGSSFATFVGVHRITNFVPSPPGGSLEQIACAGATSTQARLEFEARTDAGGYAIQIGGVGGETGTLQLGIRCAPGCPPMNDDIGSIVLFELPYVDNGLDTSGASVQPDEPLPCGGIGKTVWYQFTTSDEADQVTLTAVATEFSPVIALYTIDYTISPSPPGAFSEMACVVAAGPGEYLSHTFTTEPFTSYHVQVGGAEGAGGGMSVLLSCQRPPDQSPCRFAEDPPETGQGGGDEGVPPDVGGDATGGGSGAIGAPDTGSGGQKGARPSR
jgi:hypothetical protein